MSSIAWWSWGAGWIERSALLPFPTPPGDRLYSPVTMPNQPQSRAEFVASLPRKRMAAGVLVMDESGRVLVVKPTYRDGWLIPGGAVEADEAPSETCRREVAEELGIALPVGRLLCVEYLPAYEDLTESVQLIFDGGVMTASICEQLQLPPDELSEARFAPAEEAGRLLNPRLAVRAAYALDALKTGTVHYLEDGRPVAANP